MKKIIFAVFCIISLQSAWAQSSVETTFYAYKDSQFVSSPKRSLFDSEDIYDKKNRLVEKKYLGAATKGSRVEFKYNDKNLKTEEKHLDSTGQVRTVKKYTYTDSGKVKEVIMSWKEKSGEPRSSTEEYFYNDKNEAIKKTYTTSKNGLENEWLFETRYENGNKIVKTRHILKGKEQKAMEVIYNDKDLVIKEGNITYEYEYDDKGFWVKKRMISKGEIKGEYRRARKK